MPLDLEEVRRRIVFLLAELDQESELSEQIADSLANGLWPSIEAAYRSDYTLQYLRKVLDEWYPEVAAELKFRLSGTSSSW
jgi:hypothetical protein